MKRIALYLLASLAFIAGAAAFVYVSARGKPILRLYNWADYISDEVVKDFERQFDCEVRVYVYYSNEEMYDNLKNGGTDYDVVVPSSYMAARLYKEGLAEKLDRAKLPNVNDNIDKSYLKYSLDKDMEYCVPYFVSFTGIGYDTTRVKDFKPSWKIFAEESPLRRSLLDDQREVLGAALKALGKSANSAAPDDLAAATELALKWKEHTKRFDVDAAKLSLAEGQLDLIHTYSGDILQEKSNNPNLAFAIPEEGSTFTLDNLVILKGGRNHDLALQFVNFLYVPEISAKNMNKIKYLSPNHKAMSMVLAELRNDTSAFNIPEATRMKCELLQDLDEEGEERFDAAWEKIHPKTPAAAPTAPENEPGS